MQRTVFGFSTAIVEATPARTARGRKGDPRGVLTCVLVGSRQAWPEQSGRRRPRRANASLAAGYGYAGILVAFLARHNGLAIIPVALFLGGIAASGGLLQRVFGLPDATVRRTSRPVVRGVDWSDTLAGRLRSRRPKEA